MKLHLEISLDNASFEEDLRGQLDDIFSYVTLKMPMHMGEPETGRFKLFDRNGNAVGFAQVVDS